MSAETWEQSYAIKYINYEAEPGHVNLENPLQGRNSIGKMKTLFISTG